MSGIELSDEQIAALTARAAVEGLSLQAWLQQLADEQSGVVSRPTLPQGAEKARMFKEWASNHRPTPPLSDEAIKRSHLVRDVR